MTLNCNFRYLTDLEDNSREVYTCESINFTNRVQNVPINYVTNLHELGRRDRDVKVFIVKQQICNFLPTKVENFFPFLQEIEVDSSGLRKLYRENFAPLVHLTMAIFPGNDIEFLPGDLFMNNHRLTHINFSQNKIKSVGSNLFDNLYVLKYLMFDDNVCFQGYGMMFDDIETVKNEILGNCSSLTIVKQEKRIIVPKVVEETKVEVKKKEEPKKEEKKLEENMIWRELPTESTKQMRSSSIVQEASIKIISICFATLFREMKINF